MDELLDLSACELVDWVQSGKISVRYLTEQVLDRIQEFSYLNAFIDTDRRVSLKRADELDKILAHGGSMLPLAGLPLAIKDNINTKDFRTTGGTPALSQHKPAEDAGAVIKLLGAGANIIGKTNMHELAFGITSNNHYTGPVRNPCDPSLIAGGSSGGTAAAVGGGIVPAGLGTDTGGSARIPAALCGICGFRPSIGRYPDTGLIRISHTRDTIGLFARQVADIGLLDSILSGEATLGSRIDLSTITIGIPRYPFYEDLEIDVSRVMMKVLQELEHIGSKLVEVELNGLSSLSEKSGFPIVLHEVVQDLAYYLDSHEIPESLETLVERIASPDVKAILAPLLAGGRIPENVYRQALNVYRPRLQRVYADCFVHTGVDIILYPTTPLTARPISDDDYVLLNGKSVPVFQTYIRNTDSSSIAGIPSLTIPAGTSDSGLPVGLSMDGAHGSDRRLINIAKAVEAMLPTPIASGGLPRPARIL